MDYYLFQSSINIYKANNLLEREREIDSCIFSLNLLSIHLFYCLSVINTGAFQVNLFILFFVVVVSLINEGSFVIYLFHANKIKS